MARMVLSVGLLILTATAASGCATKALLESVEETEVGANVAAYATSAWREEAGDLVVCATGWTAKQPREGEPESFSFRLTLAQPESSWEDPGLDEPVPVDLWDPVSYPVPESAIKGSCPDKPDSALEVPVKRTSATEYGEWTSLLAPVYLEPAGPVLYSFYHSGDPEVATLVYQHETPLPGGSRLIRIELPEETLYPNKYVIVLLPLALAVDVVAVAALVVAFVVGAVACESINC